MILALLSDIHGRLDALQMAWEAASGVADLVVCLGDVIEGGGNDRDCIAFLRERGVPTVLGNHDESWKTWGTSAVMHPCDPDLQWISALPDELELEEIRFVHDDPTRLSGGSPLPDITRIRSWDHACRVFESAPVFADPLPLIVAIGHSHRPFAFHPGGELALRPGIPAHLDRAFHWIINPGTVGGTPRSAWGNTFALLNTVTRDFTVNRLDLPKTRTMWDEFFERMS